MLFDAKKFKHSEMGAFAIMRIPRNPSTDGLPTLVQVILSCPVAFTRKSVARFDTHEDAMVFAKHLSVEEKTENGERIVGFADIPWPEEVFVMHVRRVVDTQVLKPIVQSDQQERLAAQEAVDVLAL